MRKYLQYFLIMLRFIIPEILCQCHFQKLEFALLSCLYYIKYSHIYSLNSTPMYTRLKVELNFRILTFHTPFETTLIESAKKLKFIDFDRIDDYNTYIIYE